MSIKEKWTLDEYNLKAWIYTLGSVPIAQVAAENRSESYEMDKAWVLLLENGKYAFVLERGCSCYEPSDAKIELFPDEKSAMSKFEEWQRSSR